MKLSSKACTPCRVGAPKLKANEIKQYSKKVNKDWTVVKGHHIERKFNFKNFKDALSFTNKVGNLCEKEGHHADIHLAWGRVKVIIYTHKIGGLHENDFILASKIDKIK